MAKLAKIFSWQKFPHIQYNHTEYIATIVGTIIIMHSESTKLQ